eukprot:scaffold68204_cov23-Cyclotella_meneghiniana.AAC.3
MSASRHLLQSMSDEIVINRGGSECATPYLQSMVLGVTQQVGSGDLRSYLVSAYIPHKPPRSAKRETNWEQQQCFYHARGEFRNPDEILIDDLLALFKGWREAGSEVILALDANQDMYDGILATRLSECPYNMCCLLEQATGAKVPNSHFRGRRPITTIFGSNGLTVGDGMVYPHWYGVGDHRVFVVEVSAASLFGGKFPTIATVRLHDAGRTTTTS